MLALGIRQSLNSSGTDPESASPLNYRMYERSGHHPPVEQPEEFASDVLAWTAALPE
jgi:hypothetical protein